MWCGPVGSRVLQGPSRSQFFLLETGPPVFSLSPVGRDRTHSCFSVLLGWLLVARAARKDTGKHSLSWRRCVPYGSQGSDDRSRRMSWQKRSLWPFDKCNWIGRKVRPESAAGQDVSSVNQTFQHFRCSLGVWIWWRWPSHRCLLGGGGRLHDHIPAVREDSPISLRSANLKWKVSSTQAAETLALSQPIAEMEWLQVLLQKLPMTTGPWQTVRARCHRSLRSLHSHLEFVTAQCHTVGAKSVSPYDVLSNGSAASR